MYTLGSIVLLIGGFFMFLGALGIVRMPDVFNKIQAGSKATTLGFLSIIIGMIILKPEWAGETDTDRIFCSPYQPHRFPQPLPGGPRGSGVYSGEGS